MNNDPQDNNKEKFSTLFPSVKWINMGYNAGFARANNEGIRQSSGQAVLLLNPDTIIMYDAIEKCFRRLMQSEYIAASVQLLNEDRTSQITGNFFMKGGLNHLLPLPYLGVFLRFVAFSTGVKKTNVLHANEVEKVDWINGAFLMVKQTAIEKAGLLDEDFFLYSEEIEWCSRLKKQGKLCVYGNISTIHLQGESINKITNTKEKGYLELFDKKGLQLIISHHVRIRKQFGKKWFLFHLLIHTIEILIFSLCSFLDHLFRLSNPFKDWEQIKSYSKNIFRLWKLTPVIWRNKPHFYKIL
jgi:GT2 family glycosyltransferase